MSLNAGKKFTDTSGYMTVAPGALKKKTTLRLPCDGHGSFTLTVTPLYTLHAYFRT